MSDIFDKLFPPLKVVGKPLLVLIDFRDAKEIHAVEAPNADAARKHIEHVGLQWSASKKGRGYKPSPQNGLEVIYTFSDGKMAGVGYIEAVPPVKNDATSALDRSRSVKRRGPDTGRAPA